MFIKHGEVSEIVEDAIKELDINAIINFQKAQSPDYVNGAPIYLTGKELMAFRK